MARPPPYCSARCGASAARSANATTAPLRPGIGVDAIATLAPPSASRGGREELGLCEGGGEPGATRVAGARRRRRQLPRGAGDGPVGPDDVQVSTVGPTEALEGERAPRGLGEDGRDLGIRRQRRGGRFEQSDVSAELLAGCLGRVERASRCRGARIAFERPVDVERAGDRGQQADDEEGGEVRSEWQRAPRPAWCRRSSRRVHKCSCLRPPTVELELFGEAVTRSRRWAGRRAAPPGPRLCAMRRSARAQTCRTATVPQQRSKRGPFRLSSRLLARKA